VRQHKYDSVLETVTSVAVGFVIAMLTYRYIISPIYGFGSGAKESAGVVTIFTISSMIRQYLVRRFFDGKSVYQGIREMLSQRRTNRAKRK
jgi:branched-subunit amino acid ABC-type transport system permease component